MDGGMGGKFGVFQRARLSVAAALAVSWSSAAFAQQAAGPAQVDPRLKPTQAPPSIGAPIHVPVPSPPPAAPAEEAVRFTLSSVDFQGGTVLPQDSLKALAKPYIGKPVGLAEVNELAARVTASYRAAGYILTRAVVPPQRFSDGRLTLRIVEGYIDQVRIQGDAGGAKRLLEAYGRRIQAARPLTRTVLERELLLASDITGLGVRSVLTPSASAVGAADLTLVVTPKKVDASVGIDDRGSRYLGPTQLMAGVFVNDAFGTGGRLGLNGVVTPGDSPPNLAYGAISYDQPLGANGLRLFATVSDTITHPGQELTSLDTLGRAFNAELTLSYPIIRSRDLNLMVSGGLAYRNVYSSNSASSPLFDDHVRSANVGLYVNALDPVGGYSTLTLNLVQGLDILGATQLSSPNKSRAGASGEYTRLDFEVTHLQPIYGPFALQFGASGQTSFGESLLASEQYALGGYAYDRAFDPAEATGDAGLAGRVEAQWNAARRLAFLSRLQPYAFYEGGQIWQMQAVAGSPAQETLVSTGVGARFTLLDRLSADIEWAAPLGPDLRFTDSRHGRVFFSLTATF
jgi:hemolysin activation/secretion protein